MSTTGDIRTLLGSSNVRKAVMPRGASNLHGKYGKRGAEGVHDMSKAPVARLFRRRKNGIRF